MPAPLRALARTAGENVGAGGDVSSLLPVSVQGSGMGQPSMSIYVTELFRDYDVRQVVRERQQLAALGDVRTPSIADLFVAVMEAAEARGAAA